jgi:hypothetical protein
MADCTGQNYNTKGKEKLEIHEDQELENKILEEKGT